MPSPDDVRRIALSMPEAHESAHFDVTDFRVRNKIFCTLPKPGRMGLRITLEEQQALLAEDPQTFWAPQNSYGQRGWTMVELASVDPGQLAELIADAWRGAAPKRLREAHDD